MYVQRQPGLLPAHFRRRPVQSPQEPPFPLNAPCRTFSYMARGVIYHLFRSLKLGRNETVLVPDYHSGVEVWAMRAAGVNIRYYPIRGDLELDMEALRRLCTPDVRVLYVVHYLGWSQPLRELTELCRERELIMIEDCALAFQSESGGKPLGTTGDYAFYCLYKSLPVPNGGLLVQNNRVLNNLTQLELQPCSLTSLAASSAELFFEAVRGRSEAAGSALFWLKRRIGQTLSLAGVNRLPLGDISPDFSTVGLDVAKMNIAMSEFCQRLLKGFDYEAIRNTRRENFAALRDRLDGAVPMPRSDLEPGMCPLFFPVLVEDKGAAARALQERGINVTEFWNYGHPEAEQHTGAEAHFLRRHLLELPIHQDVKPEQVQYMADCMLDMRHLYGKSATQGSAHSRMVA
jgi:dTDP-4-amino-4,6-dideoxygalactose transaminase